MNQLSVVIITLNEEHNIAACIRSVQAFSNDIVVVDAQSEDNTIAIASKEGARTFSIEWQGYGYSRNFGAAKARHHWILALDADERVSDELIKSIRSLDLSDEKQIFRFSRKNYIGDRLVRFGTMGADKVTRIYNRKYNSWDLSAVHEKLESGNSNIKKIGGHVSHYAFASVNDYRTKLEQYAEMSAEKYFDEGRRASFSKRYLSPLFNSIKSYIFHLGFLEGRLGFEIAKTIAYYTRLKYSRLFQLQHNGPRPKSVVSMRTSLKPAAGER
jgi:glycosyltransferase involved in cell wall biosynthesis